MNKLETTALFLGGIVIGLVVGYIWGINLIPTPQIIHSLDNYQDGGEYIIDGYQYHLKIEDRQTGDLIFNFTKR